LLIFSLQKKALGLADKTIETYSHTLFGPCRHLRSASLRSRRYSGIPEGLT